MLSTPKNGWTELNLGNNKYELSYLTDIAGEWLEQSIFGLEHMSPFVVRGAMEPGRFICIVSFYNCYVFIEREGSSESALIEGNSTDISIDMFDFCQLLHDDISNNLDAWSSWSQKKKDVDNKVEIANKLSHLQNLIDQKRERYKNRRIL